MRKGQKKMDAKITGIISYFSWIGWLIAFLAGDKEGAKFHLNQSLVVMLGITVLSIIATVAGYIPVVGLIIRLITGICSLAFVVFWVLGLVAAIKEEEKPIPVIGGIQLLK